MKLKRILMEVSNMKLKRILTATILAVTLGLFSFNGANAANTYSISCKNDAYGIQNGGVYLDIATELYLGLATAYVGSDCVYAGASDTNGTQVVAGDVARLAVNAIVGAVSNRIDAAYNTASQTSTSATGLTFTTQNDGVSMAANKIVGGLSVWADMANSSFKNTQTYTNVRIDSMSFDGDASSYSYGVDKTFGNAIIGLVVSNLDTDIKTKFNDGTYKQAVNTYGIYIGYRTNVLQIDLGMGQGDSTIDTTRRDLGNDASIVGKTTADIEYSNARISATFVRGKFSLVPRISYRTMSMDIKAFTDDRPDDTSASVTGAGANFIFSTNNETLTVADDNVAARSVESETMDVGLTLSANLGKLAPYVDVTYTSEDTTKALYKVEAGTDTAAGSTDADVAASNYSSSVHIGGGINFMLGSHLKGGVRLGRISGRDDWDENYVAGNISLGF